MTLWSPGEVNEGLSSKVSFFARWRSCGSSFFPAKRRPKARSSGDGIIANFSAKALAVWASRWRLFPVSVNAWSFQLSPCCARSACSHLVSSNTITPCISRSHSLTASFMVLLDGGPLDTSSSTGRNKSFLTWSSMRNAFLPDGAWPCSAQSCRASWSALVTSWSSMLKYCRPRPWRSGTGAEVPMSCMLASAGPWHRRWLAVWCEERRPAGWPTPKPSVDALDEGKSDLSNRSRAGGASRPGACKLLALESSLPFERSSSPKSWRL
mmetsp:Transcript_2907/g.7857  ORF Transcript_2907/g.7857 Transcript_2907/m.7857 type:complete len:267 (-) Transcript_2907:140-940(-)